MLTEEHLDQFQREGYVIIENFFPKEEIEEATRRIDDMVRLHEEKQRQDVSGDKGAGAGTGAGAGAGTGAGRANEIIFINYVVKKDAYFQTFCAQDKFVQLTTALLGPEVAVYFDSVAYKRPETPKEFPWHQDNGYGLVLSEQYVTCWIALEDATVENGCVWVMPGSHRQGIVEHKPTPVGLQCYFGPDPGVPVTLNKGGMAVFSSLLFHRSGPNVSNATRKGYLVQYFPTHAVNIKTGKGFKKMVIAKNGLPSLDTSFIAEQDLPHTP